MPCISFIVPVYNMERLLPRALRSLRTVSGSLKCFV